MTTYDNDIRQLKDKLNTLIDNGADYEEILKVSVSLDKLIEVNMEEKER